MKSSKKFLITLSLIALVTILIFAFVFSKKSDQSEDKIDEVDYTYNILKNSGFETGKFYPWEKTFEDTRNYYAFIDDLVKYEGNFSLNVTADLYSENLGVYQKLKNFPRNKKLVLNGKIRTEDITSAFLSIELYNKEDSLLAEASTDTLKGTNDWIHLTTWVRTINPELSYIIVRCNLLGKGRVWFDKLELYPIEIENRTIIPVQRQ